MGEIRSKRCEGVGITWDPAGNVPLVVRMAGISVRFFERLSSMNCELPAKRRGRWLKHSSVTSMRPPNVFGSGQRENR